MVLLGFSVLKDKLVSHEKCQTIRLPRKHPIRVGEKAYIYWHLRQKDCEKLGEGKIKNVVRKTLYSLTLEDAIKDGFTDETDRGFNGRANWKLVDTLKQLHKGIDGATEFDVISWEWTA